MAVRRWLAWRAAEEARNLSAAATVVVESVNRRTSLSDRRSLR